MSMHKKPLTELEREGLIAHGLDIGTPSQLSDVFRQGIAFALANAPTVQREGWVSVEDIAELECALCVIGVVGNIDGHDVIRRESVIDIARDRIRKLKDSKNDRT